MSMAEDYTETDQLVVGDQHLKYKYEKLQRENKRLQ